MVGHIPYTLVEILLSLIKTWKIYSMKPIISEKHRAASEGKWVHGEGIKISCIYECFGHRNHKTFVRENKKTVNVNHFTFL